MATQPIHPTKVCTKCGVERPATIELFYANKLGRFGLQSRCKLCVGELQRDQAASNRERSNRWRLKNQDCVRQARERNRADPEWVAKTQAYMREHYFAHKAVYNERSQRWHKENVRRARDLRRALYHEFPERHRQYWHNRRARLRQAAGSFTDDDLKIIRKAQGDRCFYCEEGLAGGGAVDHFVPLVLGGSNFPLNIRLACRRCNSSKGAKLPWVWMPERFSPPKEETAIAIA